MIGKDVVVGRSGNFPYFRTVRGVLERIDAWSDFVIQWHYALRAHHLGTKKITHSLLADTNM